MLGWLFVLTHVRVGIWANSVSAMSLNFIWNWDEMKVSSSFGIKPFSSYRVCVCVQARILLVYALGVKDGFWQGRSRKTQVWCFNETRDGKCATNHCSKITISEEHWEGKFSAPASTAYMIQCSAFPSRRGVVMTLQAWVKKTRSHGCLWFSHASGHHAQEGIFPFAC